MVLCRYWQWNNADELFYKMAQFVGQNRRRWAAHQNLPAAVSQGRKSAGLAAPAWLNGGADALAVQAADVGQSLWRQAGNSKTHSQINNCR
jgi:hypothetical protein